MDSAKYLKGPINTSRSKADLVAIANDLGISSEGTVKQLLPRIKTYLKDQSAVLSVQPKYQALFAYRPPKIVHGHEKVPGKTSTDKAAEDVHESEKPKEATG